MKPGSADAKLQIRVYLRTSHAGEESIMENQRRNAEAHARSISDRVRIYEEVASGGPGERVAFNQLFRDVRRGDLVVFTSLSRMTRGGVAAALEILRQLELHGAGWHFVEQPMLNYDSTTPKLAKDIILAVLAAVDEDYRRRISEATKAALARRKALGHPIGRLKGAKDKRPRKKRPPRSQLVGMRSEQGSRLLHTSKETNET